MRFSFEEMDDQEVKDTSVFRINIEDHTFQRFLWIADRAQSIDCYGSLAIDYRFMWE